MALSVSASASFQQTTLDNGLRVILREVRERPLVGVWMWYHVGGRNVTLTIRVSQHGKAVKGIRVKVKGACLNLTTKASNDKGMVTVKVNPKKAGIVTIVPVSHKGCANPRIGVCAINPHAGEGGLFGRGEEATKIEPAIAACRAAGWSVDGPLPADTLFFRAGRGDFDLVVAMYHDQGHGPIKVLGIEAGVNITVGLPVVLTSVDHGTAFDIAGTGAADERSLLEAIRQAVELAHRPH